MIAAEQQPMLAIAAEERQKKAGQSGGRGRKKTLPTIVGKVSRLGRLLPKLTTAERRKVVLFASSQGA